MLPKLTLPDTLFSNGSTHTRTSCSPSVLPDGPAHAHRLADGMGQVTMETSYCGKLDCPYATYFTPL